MTNRNKILYATALTLVLLAILSIVGAGIVRAESRDAVMDVGVNSNNIQKKPDNFPGTNQESILKSLGGLAQLVGEMTQPKVFVQDISSDKLVIGGSFTLRTGEVLNGSLIVFGGTAEIEVGATVGGDVAVFGGTAVINGEIKGDIIVLGGLLVLGPTAVVDNDVSVIGGNLDQNPGAVVSGDVNTGVDGPFSITFPGDISVPIPGGGNFPKIQITTNPFWEGLWVLFRSLFIAALAVLAVLFLPKSTERIGHVGIKQAPVSGGVGCLTVVILPIILVITAITIIGIPITILLSVVFVLVGIYGVIALGTETGKRLAVMLKVDWALAVSAGAGTFLLWLVVEGLNWIIPCVGGIPMFLVSLVGIGAVLLTRFGTRDYPYYVSSGLAPINNPQDIHDTAGDVTGLTPGVDDDQSVDQDDPV